MGSCFFFFGLCTSYTHFSFYTDPISTLDKLKEYSDTQWSGSDPPPPGAGSDWVLNSELPVCSVAI